MKLLVFISIVFLSTSLLAQNWTDVIDTDLNVSSASGVVEFGGKIVAEGTPEQIVRDSKSVTGKFLRVEFV